MMESEQIKLYPASAARMERMIAAERDGELKKAYSEMLAGSLSLFCGGKGLNQSVALAKAGAEVYHA